MGCEQSRFEVDGGEVEGEGSDLEGREVRRDTRGCEDLRKTKKRIQNLLFERTGAIDSEKLTFVEADSQNNRTRGLRLDSSI